MRGEVAEMLDIVLVNPYPDKAKAINEATIIPPLGLAYLAAVLRKDGFSTNIIDANVLKRKNEFVRDDIRKIRPRFVGISMNIVTAEPGFRLSRAIKEAGLDARIILGGVTPTIDPENALARANADFVVVGEGEQTILELVKKEQQADHSWESVKGIVFKDGTAIKKTSPRERIKDPDTLPLPAYDLLPPFRLYKTRARGFPVGNIFTSRGCPFPCTFCNKVVFGSNITFHSAERVLEEIRVLIKDYGVRQIDVLDDHFTFSRQRAIDILDGIIKRGYKIYLNLQNGVRADTLDEELIRKMRQAGVYKIGFGVESGDKDILQKIKKGLDLDKVIRVSQLARKYGIVVYGFFILGLPGDTKESMARTIDFAIKMNPVIANFGVALPFPGTEMFELIKKEGRFLDNVDIDCFCGFHKAGAFFEIGPTKKDDVEEMFKKAYTTFYFRPKKIADILMSMRSLRELKWMLDATLSSQRFRFRK